MHFAPYNIHVCISKGNVVYEAHVILLQLNCKDRYGKFTTEFHVTLYVIETAPCVVLVSFFSNGIQASINYIIVILTLLITLTVSVI